MNDCHVHDYGMIAVFMDAFSRVRKVHSRCTGHAFKTDLRHMPVLHDGAMIFTFAQFTRKSFGFDENRGLMITLL